jgi:16S rRNA (guanine527-N7)-methyltransferase
MDKLKAGAQKLGINLSPQQLELFEIYYRELIDWNRKINLTSITDYEEVQIKHFLDSLTISTALSQKDTGYALRVIDIGTGAGFPGIPFKIIQSDIKLTLLEATVKKTKFLEHMTNKLDLKDVIILPGRAENAARDICYREKYDIVLSRAVAAMPALAELTLPFCAIGGRCILQKKGDISKEQTQSEKAITVLGGFLREIKPVEIEELPDNRKLVIIYKVKETPSAYPRRPGMPVKRPIKG